MNLLYLKYAVEIASSGSINKAAEKLYMEQPNLSRAIKELEASLGVSLFERSSKGMKLTPDGKKFMEYANSILKQVEAVENMFRGEESNQNHFSISVPRTSYISEAFSSFSKRFRAEEELEMFYKETNSLRAIKNILEENYNLGIIRYAEQYDQYYQDMLEEKGLSAEIISQFTYVLIMSKHSDLAGLDNIRFSDLTDRIEIAHADPYVPSLPLSKVKKEELPDTKKRIFVFERASQFELLSKNPDTFMWVSPEPQEILQRYGLVQKVCKENTKRYRDVMIHRKDYKLSKLDQLFISELLQKKNNL